MSPLPIFLVAAVLSVSVLRAAESTELALETRPFVIRHSFTANALPKAFTLLELKAEAWSEFAITRIAVHGSRVTKGETLVAFDPQGIDRKIEDTARAIDTKTLEIAQAELDLKNLEDTTSHRQQALQRAADEAKEENDYFTMVRRKAEEENADQKLKRAEMFLENQSEELRQLKKMYEADDMTEETEEIILKRQQDRVEAAEFELRMQRLGHARSHGVLLPREAVKLAEAERDWAIVMAKFEHDAPRAIALKKIELQNLKTALEREKQSLENLKTDRKQFEITAPADGWFYHGAIENDRWSPGEAAKSLVVLGRPAIRKPFATFIPADAKLRLVASLESSVASQLAPDAVGLAWVSGREDAEFPVKLTALAAAPDADGRFKAEFSAEWPAQPAVAPAAGVNIHVISHQSQEAIVVPAKALEFGPSGWSVEVKLADGKTERRPVKRGRLHDGHCEILTGLEPGQVVIIPLSPK